MENEEIYIDGVDVSRCEFYQIEANELYPKANYCGSMRNTFCEIEPNCYYKQLKRKEQECEMLKKEIINRNEKIEELRFSVSDLTNRLCDLNAEKSFRIVDLEQTLTKIKKIAERGFQHSQCNCGAKADLDLILQKICEATNE